MAQSDAELYLRLAGERAVLDQAADQGRGDDSPLDAAGHALVAVGALPAGVAQAIVDDYGLALAYRGGEPAHFHLVRARRAGRRALTTPAPGPLRAVPCHGLIEQPWGQLFLSYVVLSYEVTVLNVTMRPASASASAPAPPGPRRAGVRRRRPAGGGRVPGGAGHRVVGPGLPGQLTVTDDRGTTSTASFSGGGSDDEWRGRFEVNPPLAPDTAWIEVLGERIGLPSAPSAGVQVRVEPRADADPAHRYLWTTLASLADSHSPGVMETSIEALVAAGALEADDPVIAEVRAVMGGLFSGAAAGTNAALPEPWRSMLARRGRAGGPLGLAVAGATTPPLDGVTLAVLALRSSDEWFCADVETVPGLPHWHWPSTSGLEDGPLLAWWAEDDRGHHYLGRQGEWHSSEDRSGGQVEFWPALDPAARVLDIMPTTMTARAVIRVPLNWDEER